MPKLISSLLIALAMVTGLGACNTVKGIGQDIEKGGEAIQKAVK